MTVDMGRLVSSPKAFVETPVFSSYLSMGRSPKVSLLWLGILKKQSISGGNNLHNGFLGMAIQHFLESAALLFREALIWGAAHPEMSLDSVGVPIAFRPPKVK